jgi:hypothetical protein
MEPIKQAFIEYSQELISPTLTKEYVKLDDEGIAQQIIDGFEPDNIIYGGDAIHFYNNKVPISQINELREKLLSEINKNQRVLSSTENILYLTEMLTFFIGVEEAIVFSNKYWFHTGMKCQNFDYNDLEDSLKEIISIGLITLKEKLRMDIVVLRKNIAYHSRLSNVNPKKAPSSVPLRNKSFQIRNKDLLTEQNLKIAVDKMIMLKLVRNITTTQLRNLLSNQDVNPPIDWVRTKESLRYFIYCLTTCSTPDLDRGIVLTIKNKWQVACRCFTLNGLELESRSLSTTKNPQAKVLKNEIRSIIQIFMERTQT